MCSTAAVRLPVWCGASNIDTAIAMETGDPCLICNSTDTSVVAHWDEPVLACHACGFNT